MIRPSRQIWLCLYFPELALEIFADHDARAIAVIEQQYVVNANSLARERGLEFAMALNTAHALCPDLLVLERQPQRELETLQQLAHWIYRASPELALADDNSLLLEIGSCRRLYNGIEPLLDLLREGLTERGHTVALGLAHTRKAAWLLARQTPPLTVTNVLNADQQLDGELLRRQLGHLPVTALAIDHTIINALQKMGIRSLKALTDLPLAALGKRFGAEFIRYLQQVLGTHPDPQPAFVPLPKFQASLAFIDGIHNRQALLFPMKRLLQTLCDYLDTRQLLCSAFQWEMHDAHEPQAALTIELMRAEQGHDNNRLRNFIELSELKLQNLPLRDAVYTLVLRSENFLPAQPNNLQLFDDDNASNTSMPTLIDKLRARLGADALEQVRYRSLHWPESASLQQTIDAAASFDNLSETEIPTEQTRPLWLLSEPQALRERDKKLFWDSALQILRGPERIGNHWWEQTYTARDYYIASAEDGRLCWIFRDLTSGKWFAHGLFS